MEFYNLKKLFLHIATLFSPCLKGCYYVVIKRFFKKLMKIFYCKIKTFDCDSNNEIKNKIILPDSGCAGQLSSVIIFLPCIFLLTYDWARTTTAQKAFHPSMLSFEIDIYKEGYGHAWSILDWQIFQLQTSGSFHGER